jgi:Secretion system C-terminal sorting domain
MNQIPINSGDASYNPLFPYGFGLKYGTTSSRPISSSYSNVEIFPVPANDYIYLKNLPEGNLHYRIVDLSGSVVLENTFLNSSLLEKINVKNLFKGVYFVEIFSENSVIVNRRIIKE